MDLDDLSSWLKKRRLTAEQNPPIIINIDLSDVLARLTTDRDEVKVRDRYAPYPS